MNRGKTAGRRCRKSDIYIPIMLSMPAFLLVMGAITYPICYAIGLSFQCYKLTDYINRQLTGLENYISIQRNEIFLASLGNTVKWVGITVACRFLLGLVSVMILNVPFWGRGIIHSTTLMLWVTPGVVIALMWVWIYNGNFGVLNKCLTSLGTIDKNTPWLGPSQTALYNQIVTMIWQGTSFFVIMILAALQTTSADLYEAADISGANSWQEFPYITLPELVSIIITTCMLRIIWVFNNVEVLYFMTGGGPGHSSIAVSLVACIKVQKFLDFGQGSTIAIYGILFMILFTTIYSKLTRRGGGDEKG